MTEDTAPFTAEEIAELKALGAERRRTGESFLLECCYAQRMKEDPSPANYLGFLKAWKPTNGPH